jgi:hypothetical protein
LPSLEKIWTVEGEEGHLEVVDGVGGARGLRHADAVDLGVLSGILLAQVVLRLLPERPVLVPLHGDLGGVVGETRLLHQILPVVAVHGLGLDGHPVVRALLGLVVVAVGDFEELLDVARLELVDGVGGLHELAFPRVLGHDLPVVVEAEGHVGTAPGGQGADDLVAEVFLDGEGDVEVDVLRLAELLGDLQHRLVFFLVVAAIPPHHQLLRLAARHHGKAHRARGGARAHGGGLEKLPAGLTHSLVSFAGDGRQQRRFWTRRDGVYRGGFADVQSRAGATAPDGRPNFLRRPQVAPCSSNQTRESSTLGLCGTKKWEEV